MSAIRHLPRLESDRLLLIQPDVSLFEQLLQGDDVLREYTGWIIEDDWSIFGRSPFRYALEKVRAEPEEAPWWTYLVLHRSKGQLIGSCGFKGRPDVEGRVEIGYEITQSFRNQGLATETAQTLVEWAFLHAEVQRVQAHTLEEDNASARVLRKVGMDLVGPVEIATHGRLWKWMVHRPGSALK